MRPAYRFPNPVAHVVLDNLDPTPPHVYLTANVIEIEDLPIPDANQYPQADSLVHRMAHIVQAIVMSLMRYGIALVVATARAVKGPLTLYTNQDTQATFSTRLMNLVQAVAAPLKGMPLVVIVFLLVNLVFSKHKLLSQYMLSS